MRHCPSENTVVSVVFGVALAMLLALASLTLAYGAIALVELHGPSGQPLEINPNEVSSVRQPLDPLHPRQHWAKGTHCILVMGNGGMNAVAEDCATVMQKLTKQ